MKLNSWTRLAFLIVAAASLASVAAMDGNGADAKTVKSGASRSTAGESGRHKTADAEQDIGTLHVELERLARAEPAPESGEQVVPGEGAGIFGATSWYVPPPPPPPAPPPPPPKPTAPPMPFTYLGRYQESETQVIILVKGDRIYTVSAGEVIENVYRVEGVISGRVELTYLPLNIKQTIDTGEVS